LARAFSKEHYIRVQKRIKKLHLDPAYYYSLPILKGLRRITPKTKGVDPDGRAKRAQ